MEDLYKNVPMLCPVCGNDQFTVLEDVENLLDAPEETQFQCSDCKTVFTKAELLENNQYIIDANIEDMEQKILKGMEKKLKKIFK